MPTDNLYKFTCLFGLALIVSAVVSFVALYTSSLDTKLKYNEVIVEIHAIPEAQRTPIQVARLASKKELMKLTMDNEDQTRSMLAVLLGAGIMLSAAGASVWYQRVQKQDDQMGAAQLRKVRAEAELLERQVLAGATTVGKAPQLDSQTRS